MKGERKAEMDVLIINPPIGLSDKPRNIPHGLAILANIIRSRLDITPTFLDINAYRYSEKETERIIENTDFDVVLMGGLTPTYSTIIKLSEFIKSVHPDVKIIAGGYVAMPIPEVLLKNSEVAIICTGEGEITIVELLSRLERSLNVQFNGIAGICYKKNNAKNKIVFTQSRPLIQNLDEQSVLSAYDLLPVDIYLSNPVVGIGRDIDFIASRGCPYQCTFCYQPWGQKFRWHSVNFIIKSLIFLKKKYNIDFISFQDDEFMARKSRYMSFVKKEIVFYPIYYGHVLEGLM